MKRLGHVAIKASVLKSRQTICTVKRECDTAIKQSEKVIECKRLSSFLRLRDVEGKMIELATNNQLMALMVSRRGQKTKAGFPGFGRSSMSPKRNWFLFKATRKCRWFHKPHRFRKDAKCSYYKNSPWEEHANSFYMNRTSPLNTHTEPRLKLSYLNVT